MDWNRAMNLPGYSVSLRHNRTITEEWLDGHYSVLYVEVVIERELLNLLLGVYFSTFQIIIIMLSTFWLSSFLICDRINIGVVSSFFENFKQILCSAPNPILAKVSVLALYDQYNESKKDLPSIGYMHVSVPSVLSAALSESANAHQNGLFSKSFLPNSRWPTGSSSACFSYSGSCCRIRYSTGL